MRKLRTVLGLGAALLGGGALVLGTGVANAAGPRPNFQLPFACGQTWNGNNPNSRAHRTPWELDFNRGGSPGADLGEPVLATAAGKVATSAHQGSANGYGNLVVIDHGGGWKTYYAHLKMRAVAKGNTVAQGQKIGEVGNTSRPGNDISPHLHYEVRTNDASYPRNIQPASFNGVRFSYPAGNVRSNNCGGGSANPYDPAEVCGAGYKQIDAAPLNENGNKVGTVYLTYNSGNGNNCVTTIKETNIGIESLTSAYLQVQGGRRTTDSGSFEYYAGPVRAEAAGNCVYWGGSVGSAKYDSPLEHCG